MACTGIAKLVFSRSDAFHVLIPTTANPAAAFSSLISKGPPELPASTCAVCCTKGSSFPLVRDLIWALAFDTIPCPSCHRCHEIVLRARATVGGYPYRIVRYYLSPVLREKLYFFDRGRSRFHQQDRRGHIYHRQQKHLYPMDHGARTLAVERCGKYQSQSNRA